MASLEEVAVGERSRYRTRKSTGDSDAGAATLSFILCATLGFVLLGLGSIQVVTWCHVRNVAQTAAAQAALAAAAEGATVADGKRAAQQVAPDIALNVVITKGTESVTSQVSASMHTILIGQVTVTSEAEAGVERFVPIP